MTNNFEDILKNMESSTINKSSAEYKKEYQRLYREKLKNDPEYKEKMKLYKQNNPDKYKKYNKKWRDNNKDKIKDYQQTHKEQINEYNKRYFKEMRDTYNALK